MKPTGEHKGHESCICQSPYNFTDQALPECPIHGAKATSNPTDKQLQLALAKMLPEMIFKCPTNWNNNSGFELCWRKEPCDYNISNADKVKETEWLHVCWLIEKALDHQEIRKFVNELNMNDGFYDATNDWQQLFRFATASWQQEAIVLCKVKGITP